MKDNKDTKENIGGASDIAETVAPRVSGAPVSSTEPTPVKTDSNRITTEAQAKDLIKDYKVPVGCRVVIVTEDRNVFWQDNEGSAQNHAQKNNLKLFRIEC